MQPPGPFTWSSESFLCAEHRGELSQQAESGLAALVLECVDGRREARYRLQLARALEDEVRLPRFEQQVDGDRRLVGEEPKSSISCRLKSVCSGRSSTERTPSAPSSCRSGAAIRPFGT